MILYLLVPYKLAVCTSCGTSGVQNKTMGSHSLSPAKGEYIDNKRNSSLRINLYHFPTSLLPCSIFTLSSTARGCQQVYNIDKHNW